MENDLNFELKKFWNNYGDRELYREKNDPRKQIHTDLIWRELKSCINARHRLKILDAGAGTGRFSIPLAQEGHEIIHLDISEKMIEIARKNAESRKIENIQFVQGDICKGLEFEDNTFDLVLCLDSPLSYCYKNYENILSELIRVSRWKIVLCVMNRYGTILEGGVDFDLTHFGKLKTVRDVYATGNLIVTEELRKLQPTLFPSWHAFTPDELKMLLERHGCYVEKLSAPGTLARSVDIKLLKQLLVDRKSYEDYLNFEEEFDKNTCVLWIGAIGAGGLFVTATKDLNNTNANGV